MLNIKYILLHRFFGKRMNTTPIQTITHWAEQRGNVRKAGKLTCKAGKKLMDVAHVTRDAGFGKS